MKLLLIPIQYEFTIKSYQKYNFCAKSIYQIQNKDFNNWHMNLIQYLDEDLYYNSLDLILGITPLYSPHTSENQPEYSADSSAENCETYQWIWEDNNSRTHPLSKEQDDQIHEMMEARSQQQNRLKQYLRWASKILPRKNDNPRNEKRRRIKKQQRRRKGSK